MIWTTLTFFLISVANADVYMHSPRGSNNRLNEQSAARTNGNRLFDSQNNNRGGYNVGDKTDTPFAQTSTSDPDGITSGNIQKTFDDSTADGDGVQYPMIHLEGSILPIEWTAQHGCGGDSDDVHKNNCNMVIQYICDTDDTAVTDAALKVTLRDGATTNAPTAPNTNGQTGAASIANARNTNDGNPVRGRQESEEYYYECIARSRNRGLFIADQNLNARNTAKNTRQNPQGTRRGLECPEERDYFPYWGPSPFRDIAWIGNSTQWCESNIKPKSQNTATKYKCVDTSGQYTQTRIFPITQNQCTAAGGSWQGFTHTAPAMECVKAKWGRSNHLGNSRDGAAMSYNWTIPTFAQLVASGVKVYDNKIARCAVRLRYNISTDDYDGWTIDAASNGNNSPIEEDPIVDVLGDYEFYDFNGNNRVNEEGLRLELNTNQYGRVFQTRSHVFYVKKKETAVDTLLGTSGKLYNLNVRGKRGNIVQTYPAVEYDFVPKFLEVEVGDVLHLQWTGSNTHDNNNPAGDGQAGDDGQGTGGTDRNNFVQLRNFDDNYPLPYDKFPDIFDDVDCFTYEGVAIPTSNCKVILATSGQFWTTAEAIAGQGNFNTLLNNAPASLRRGVLMKFKTSAATKEFNYMCTRNNNFSNRSQKGVLKVKAAT